MRQDKPVPSHRKTSVGLEVSHQAWQAGGVAAAVYWEVKGLGGTHRLGWPSPVNCCLSFMKRKL